MLKYDEYIHCFTFLDYLTQSIYLTLYHFIEVIFLSFFRNARSLFCSSSSSWVLIIYMSIMIQLLRGKKKILRLTQKKKKDWRKFIFLSNMTTSLQFHLHFLMRSHNWLLAYFDGVSKSSRNICIVSLKKNCIQGNKGFFITANLSDEK